MTTAIETHNLHKAFGGKVAVEGLTLSVRRGEVFGFLGPNGAGKSTSVKMLLGLVHPTGGEANVLGRPLGDVGIRAKTGFLPEHFRFHDWLTAREFLRYHARLYGMREPRIDSRTAALLELVGLAAHRDKRLKEFSKGMLQRIGLAQALLNEPELVFLDEPTSGLDPVGRLLVRDIIRDQRERGATVFLNSHLLGEVEVTCDRVAFIRHGRVLEMRELGKTGDDGLALAIRAAGVCEDALRGLRQWAGAVRVNGDLLDLEIATEDVIPAIVSHLAGSGARVYSVTCRQASLEELFLRIVGVDGGL
ncbi:MAG TPA: ABC transporter ATP-binding protein [Bryobacteraceae bacterium]|nr:ABC transporter ATP-binding protein [Bryobacteraceae bacterium]